MAAARICQGQALSLALLALVCLGLALQAPAFLGTQSTRQQTQLSTAVPRAAPVQVPRADAAPGSAVTAFCALACGCAAAALLRRPHSLQKKRVTAVRKAGDSILDMMGEEDESDRMDEEQAKQMEADMAAEEATFSEDMLSEVEEVVEESESDLARRGERQAVYNLYPAKKYVQYIAMENAKRTWRGPIPIKVACLTEKIRSHVIHLKDMPKDIIARISLVKKIAKRRRLLDKLSWTNIDSYLEVREKLKIRHTYRMEVLIGRARELRYGAIGRPQMPGVAQSTRLKKSRKLLTKRLARYLQRGKAPQLIQKTKTLIKGRQWLARAYDDAQNMLVDKPVEKYWDPLAQP